MERNFIKRYALIILFLLFPFNSYSAPPTRTYTYTAGEVIDPNKVTTNEDNLYNYLTIGVDTYADSTIVNADISGSAVIAYSKLSLGSSILTGDIKDGEIVNADISSSAAIALSKLASTPMLYTDTRFITGSFTRDTTLASGTQAVTGVGFSPKAVIFFANEDTLKEISWGIDDGTTALSVRNASAGGGLFGEETLFSLADIESASDYYRGEITSLDTNGFTVTWTKTGSPTGTIRVMYLAFR